MKLHIRRNWKWLNTVAMKKAVPQACKLYIPSFFKGLASALVRVPPLKQATLQPEDFKMPALPRAQYGLEELHLFPYYQTREDYRAKTGHDAPPWNPNRPPKAWEDLKANDSARRNVVYDSVIAYAKNGAPLVDANEKPMLDVLVLTKEEAASVNIPPKGPTVSNIAGADVPEIPPPLRALQPTEELFMPFFGVVAVRNRDFMPLEPGFNQNDRSLLKAIAQKLGIA